jgi:hypothetical protein
MNEPTHSSAESDEDLARLHYCVCGPDGREDPERLRCAEAVQEFLLLVESNARLQALSFVDPLRVANELGITVSPLVAHNTPRSGWGSLLDVNSLDSEGRLVGVGEIRRRPKREGQANGPQSIWLQRCHRA